MVFSDKPGWHFLGGSLGGWIWTRCEKNMARYPCWRPSCFTSLGPHVRDGLLEIAVGLNNYTSRLTGLEFFLAVIPLVGCLDPQLIPNTQKLGSGYLKVNPPLLTQFVCPSPQVSRVCVDSCLLTSLNKELGRLGSSSSGLCLQAASLWFPPL